MYTREDKLKAVELFIKYDFSPQSYFMKSSATHAGDRSTTGIGNI